jgi:hypothetical protein
MSVRRAVKRTAKKALSVGDVLIAQTYALRDADGMVGLFWYSVPEGMTDQQASETQPHRGPFKTKSELMEDQRITLLGEQGVVKEGGMWDPAWDKPQ